ncbi:MAG: DUF378 domain-containing protein [Candidatus Pacearchaeota archaeon]
MEKNALDWIAGILVIIGALNWGLIAINSNWDVVSLIVGQMSEIIARIIYGLIGLAGLYAIYMMVKK